MKAFTLPAAAILLASAALGAGKPAQPRPAKQICTLTNEKISGCCCEARNGKLFCTKGQKEIATCCCEPVEKADKKPSS